jgi:GDP-mannose pyrophosphatase NudK
VVLVRQFRLPAYLRDRQESLLEVCAGRLEGEDPERRIIKEAEEETGFAVQNPRRLFEAYMSSGSFAEKLTFFVAEYSAGYKIGAGGGREEEDIEILELTLEEALRWWPLAKSLTQRPSFYCNMPGSLVSCVAIVMRA